jgi:hypothetical protein
VYQLRNLVTGCQGLGSPSERGKQAKAAEMEAQMTTTVAIEPLTLQDLEQRFGLQRSADPDFFREWRDRLPELGAIEHDRRQRIQASYANLARRSVLENPIKNFEPYTVQKESGSPPG